MTDAQTTNDALALVTRSCAYAKVLAPIPAARTVFTAVRRPASCQLLVHRSATRIRMGRMALSFARAAVPRSP